VRADLAPDKDGERNFLPPPETLTGKLLLLDRGYQDLGYWGALTRSGAFFIARGKCDLNPTILKAWVSGRRAKELQGRQLQAIRANLPHRAIELVVHWPRYRDLTLELRLVLLWNPATRQFTTLVTNVPRKVLMAHQVAETYRLRWQVELIFKEWKSFANLHEFASANPALVEGLIWASLTAAAIKRSLAHACQRTKAGIAVSTQIAAMSGIHILRELLRCAVNQFRGLVPAIKHVFAYLCDNATRAHPARDRLKGRLRAGLVHVGARA